MTSNNDELSKTLRWRVKSLKIFVKAFKRYIEVASPFVTEDNTELNKEYKDIQRFLSYFEEQIENGDGDYDFVDLIFLGKSWGKIYDLMWKYNGWKKQLFDERERIIVIKAALEGDKKHLEEINEILNNDCWSLFNRCPILIDSFYNVIHPKTDDPIIQQVFNIETLNGVLAGTNNGIITQNNESKKVLKAIQEITNILEKEYLENKNTPEILSNLQEIQGELLKPFPDNLKMKKAADGLQTVANITQIGSFAVAIAPHLQTIQQFISKFI
ncbi:MAG: hypothetical protein WC720_01200 [Candidatus Shapirobacteria bacterium]|jgi:hypothetical protein